MKNITYLVLYFALLLPQFVSAQTPSGGSSGGGTPSGGGIRINNPLTVTSITDLFRMLLEILLIFAIPIVVFFIILAGFKYVTARGNVSKVEEAHRALLYAVVGGLFILGASVLIDVIQGTVDAVKQ